MQRKVLDKLVSWFGISIAAMLIVAGSLLTWAHNFVANEVKTQLTAQQIFFPAADSPAIAGPEYAEIRKDGGEQLTTGVQAKAYADHYIAVHLKASGGGLTYAQLSEQSRANPDDAALAGKVASSFKGETLRGLLLNAYAFGTMATIAGIAAIVAFVGAGVMLLLAGLGLVHGRKTTPTETVFAEPRVLVGTNA